MQIAACSSTGIFAARCVAFEELNRKLVLKRCVVAVSKAQLSPKWSKGFQTAVLLLLLLLLLLVVACCCCCCCCIIMLLNAAKDHHDHETPALAVLLA